jgi:uncharacterized protein (TIGR04255 family)
MDIRVTPRDGLDVDELRAIAEAVPQFSDVQDQFTITAGLQLGSAPSQTITPIKNGFQFATEPRSEMLQVQRNGWAFNKFAPYDSWKTFSEAGWRLWNNYRDLARPKEIKRVALRYLNRLDLPLPFADFKEYVLTVPEVAPKLPQGLSNFFMQVQIPQNDIAALVIVNVALVPPPACP